MVSLHHREVHEIAILAVGVVVGTAFGLFGVGGSSLATPLLALVGVPAAVAVASPLPATAPAAITAARAYVRRGELDLRIAALSIAGGAPAAVGGALISDRLGGAVLFIASGVVLAAVGVRVMRPLPAVPTTRRNGTAVVLVGAAGVGLLTGVLANGGGFLLVPLYLLVIGLSMRSAAGTSLAVITVLSIPTLITHWMLGHIDWQVAAAFTAGTVPAAAVGSRLADRIEAERLRCAFGVVLVLFAAAFLLRQIL
jgi:uncharacterized membrane protein YfcA